MAWRRLGCVYEPDGSKEWARSHAALPTAFHLRDDLFRVFFSARDENSRSSIGWVDVELGEPARIVRIGEDPVLAPGAPGGFDDSGVGIGSIVHDGSAHRLYYMGWNLGVVAPWRNSIGVAAGDATAPSFERMFAGPIMDRSPEDPYTLSYPWVIRQGEDDWKAWYGSNRAWGAESSDMEHVIKFAWSKDGLRWERSAEPAIDFADPSEYALARPCVLFDRGQYRMWFATRGDRYRIGAAVSDDGAAWRRCDDEYGLRPAPEGWDSEMVCYPCVFRHSGRMFILYNGNAYGRAGFGLAVWE